MSAHDQKRLQEHMHLAELLGADIATVYGEDVSYQIAEFARLYGITQIVIGRSSVRRRHFWSKPTLTEKLSEMAPNLDIHIIPDSTVRIVQKPRREDFVRQLVPRPKDMIITALLLFVATLIGIFFLKLGFTESNIIAVYIFGVLLTSLATKGFVCSLIASVFSVFLFNFFLTEPRLNFHAYDAGYPVTFVVMLAVSILTGTLASRLKDQAKLSAQTAFRTKVLLDTNQLLQKAKDEHEIMDITANQLVKLLDRDVVVYLEEDGKIENGHLYRKIAEVEEQRFFSSIERSAVIWAFSNEACSGATTDRYGDAICFYRPVCINHKVYGVVGIYVHHALLDTFENSIWLSILGECALAIENSRNAKEKEQAAVLAKNEQLRANLLRAISHDLRTPLTSISGNASNLLSHESQLSQATKMQMYTDIYDDAQWLITLVENLLSVTRIEDGTMHLHTSVQLMEEVVDEALRHIHRKSTEHPISVTYQQELILARIDAKLVIQVIINLVDNAIKYTPAGSEIRIIVSQQAETVSVSIEDNGEGIPDSLKSRVFEMFFTGKNQIADSRRSLGLGLSLCKSIINAHGGEITLTDNTPHGSIFTFTLPSGEVNIHE